MPVKPFKSIAGHAEGRGKGACARFLCLFQERFLGPLAQRTGFRNVLIMDDTL